MKDTRTTVRQALTAGYQAQLDKPDIDGVTSTGKVIAYIDRLEKAFEEQAAHLAYLIDPESQAKRIAYDELAKREITIRDNLLDKINNLAERVIPTTEEIQQLHAFIEMYQTWRRIS